MIVVDTNVLAHLLLPGTVTSPAQTLLEQEPNWAAPLLWRSEFRNVLCGYMRRGLQSISEAREIQCRAEGILAGHEYRVASGPVFDLVAASTCTAYDCEFVALALQLGVPLVTCDRQILRDFPELTVDLMST
ncbi:MAG: type II toxin-antitoxin system VapC family toxin [Rhodocyclaceae bacterium]|nr:type II toxin-antitoxin system VapC family toxin [Rhodocyclaceae bacterium]